MGILVGWIVQRRWLTLAAVLLWLIGVFTLPWLPAPFSYLVLFLPVLFFMALIYEGSARFGLRLSPRLRTIWALWIGLSMAGLMAAILFGDSSQGLFIASVAVFAVLAMTGTITMALIHGRRVRAEQSTREAPVGASPDQ